MEHGLDMVLALRDSPPEPPIAGKKNSISINVYPLHPQKKVVGATPPHLQVVVVDHFLPIARQG